MIEMTGFVNFIGIARQPDTFVTTGVAEAVVDFGGFPGDRHYGVTMLSGSRQAYYPRGTEIRNNRQFSLLSAEELAGVAESLGLAVFQPEWIGANLVLSGVPGLSKLPALTRLLFPGEAVLVIEGENNPCIHAGNEVQKANRGVSDLTTRFVEKALHRRGVVGWVERPGLIRVDDKVRVIGP